MNYFKLCTLLLVVFSITFTYSYAQQTDFELIKGRVFSEYQKSTNATALDNTVATILNSITANGSWKDINYQDQSLSSWEPDKHIKRIGKLSLAYTRTDSKYYQDQQTYERLIAAMNFWVNLNPEPKSKNWWWTSISIPKEVGKLLIAMRYGKHQLPPNLEKAMIQWMNKTVSITKSPGGDGSNLTDIAQHMIMQAVLIEDAGLLKEAIQAVSESIVISTKDGIQRDLSFHAHGPELYIHGYGREYLSGIRNVEVYVQGTNYSFTPTQIALISDFTRKGFIPVIRGKYLDYAVIGRSIANKNGTRTNSGLIQQLRDIDIPEHRAEYDAAIARINGTEPPSFGIKPNHTHYWRSDYSLHTRPEFMVSVNIASSRTIRTESGNGANLNGQFLTEGAMYIAVKGDEYFNIFPNWEWNKIPGTTTPENKNLRKRTNWVADLGNADFVGGVSNGRNGVSVYNMDAYNTSAKKSWFFFEDVIVCLGADIAANRPENINTTINQSRLRGNIQIYSDGKAQQFNQAQAKLNHTAWIIHDDIAYYFPENQEVLLSAQLEKGAWSDINSNSSKEPVNQEVFKLWINHGLNPRGANYSYFILPGVSAEAELAARNTSSLKILSNTGKTQVVYDQRNELLGFVFYENGGFYWEDKSISVSEAGLLQLQKLDSNTWELSYAEPTQLKQGKVYIDLSISGKTQRVEIELPAGEYAGSTVTKLVEF